MVGKLFMERGNEWSYMNSWREGDPMSILRKCSFYRDSKNPAPGLSVGYCDLKRMICNGDTLFCRNLELLKKHHLERARAKR
jgi:hypothetical protein